MGVSVTAATQGLLVATWRGLSWIVATGWAMLALLLALAWAMPWHVDGVERAQRRLGQRTSRGQQPPIEGTEGESIEELARGSQEYV